MAGTATVEPGDDVRAQPDAWPPHDFPGRPVVFGGCFGWLHPADPAASRAAGVLIVNGVGRDGRCAHLPLRLLAEQLAAAGFPTLRYDHPGQGDSLDIAAGSEAFATWTQGVADAAEALRALSGLDQVAVIGLRLGALLAALAPIGAEAQVLLAPVASGRRWLRELKLAGAMGGSLQDQEAGAFEAEGLSLTRQTMTALNGLSPSSVIQAAPRVLVAAPETGDGGLADRLSALGAGVTRVAFPGFDALFADAHSNRAPGQLFDQVMAWLQAEIPLAAAPPAPPPPQPALLRPAGATERPTRFAHDLFGMVCMPDRLAEGGRAVIFCNTGGDPHAGIGSFATLAARSLAVEGIASLRFDFAGLGDSPAAGGEQRSHVYETPREADLDAAVALMRDFGCGRVILVGACAGAYHALAGAVRDPRVEGAFAVSPTKLVWRPGDSLAIGRADQGKTVHAYAHAVASKDTWLRLIRGRIDLAAVGRTVVTRLAARLPSRALIEQVGRLRADMAALSARGGRAHLLMGFGDSSVDEMETYFGQGGRWLTARPGMSATVRPELDHGLALEESRAFAFRELLAFAQARSS